MGLRNALLEPRVQKPDTFHFNSSGKSYCKAINYYVTYILSQVEIMAQKKYHLVYRGKKDSPSERAGFPRAPSGEGRGGCQE